MKAGKLDRRIAIEREVELVDDFGTVSRAWTPVATVWAQMIRAGTDERIANAIETTETAVVFRIRYRPGLELTDRVTYAGRAFNIVGVDEIGRREGLELTCRGSS